MDPGSSSDGIVLLARQGRAGSSLRSTTARVAALLHDGVFPLVCLCPPAPGEALVDLPMEVAAPGLQGLGCREKAE